MIDGYEYELRLTEDLDDGRYHEELEDWSRKKTKAVIAERGYIEGRVRHIPVHQVVNCCVLANLGCAIVLRTCWDSFESWGIVVASVDR
jgi:hypothetical protein